MGHEEVKKLTSDNKEWLRTTMSCEPEIEEVQKLLHKYQSEIEELSKQNLESKSELKKALDQYDDKLEIYQVLKAENKALEDDFKQKSVSKKKIVDLLNTRIKEYEMKTKDIEKQFYKEQSLDMKQFVKQYMTERREFHKQQIYKHKVNA